ncbi:MAG TPA: PilZ domain-containing protein [Terriglobales bacterium]|jgi:hypothetical protein|nr:PilZ domain-containing protein [Terriglobales bacterium]
MQQPRPERRTEERYSLRLPVIVRSLDNGTREQTCVTHDVSARGAFFHLESKLPEGAAIEMVLTLPSELTLTESLRVRCRGKVVRVIESKAGPSVGVAAIIEQYDLTPGTN